MATVSASIIPPPASQKRSIASTWAGSWTRSSIARVASGASSSSSPGHPASSIARSIARIRPAFSGCGPVSCSSEEAWRKKQARHR